MKRLGNAKLVWENLTGSYTKPSEVNTTVSIVLFILISVDLRSDEYLHYSEI